MKSKEKKSIYFRNLNTSNYDNLLLLFYYYYYFFLIFIFFFNFYIYIYFYFYFYFFQIIKVFINNFLLSIIKLIVNQNI